MAHKKHKSRMKHSSKTGKSQTLKERQRQANKKFLIRNPNFSWAIPYPSAER